MVIVVCLSGQVDIAGDHCLWHKVFSMVIAGRAKWFCGHSYWHVACLWSTLVAYSMPLVIAGGMQCHRHWNIVFPESSLVAHSVPMVIAGGTQCSSLLEQVFLWSPPMACSMPVVISWWHKVSTVVTSEKVPQGHRCWHMFCLWSALVGQSSPWSSLVAHSGTVVIAGGT